MENLRALWEETVIIWTDCRQIPNVLMRKGTIVINGQGLISISPSALSSRRQKYSKGKRNQRLLSFGKKGATGQGDDVRLSPRGL